jgi:hypothetical protein
MSKYRRFENSEPHSKVIRRYSKARNPRDLELALPRPDPEASAEKSARRDSVIKNPASQYVNSWADPRKLGGMLGRPDNPLKDIRMRGEIIKNSVPFKKTQNKFQKMQFNGPKSRIQDENPKIVENQSFGLGREDFIKPLREAAGFIDKIDFTLK